MKRIICDRCGTQTEPDPYGSAPVGSSWLSLTWRKDYKTADFCSPACALSALTPAPATVDVIPEAVVVHDVERTIEDAERLDKIVGPAGETITVQALMAVAPAGVVASHDALDEARSADMAAGF